MLVSGSKAIREGVTPALPCQIVGYFHRTHFGPLLSHARGPPDAGCLKNGSSVSSISKASSCVSSSRSNLTTSHHSLKPTTFGRPLFLQPLRRGPCSLFEMRDERPGEGPGLIAGGGCALSEAGSCIGVAEGIKEANSVLVRGTGIGEDEGQVSELVH